MRSEFGGWELDEFDDLQCLVKAFPVIAFPHFSRQQQRTFLQLEAQAEEGRQQRFDEEGTAEPPTYPLALTREQAVLLSTIAQRIGLAYNPLHRLLEIANLSVPKDK